MRRVLKTPVAGLFQVIQTMSVYDTPVKEGIDSEYTRYPSNAAGSVGCRNRTGTGG